MKKGLNVIKVDLVYQNLSIHVVAIIRYFYCFFFFIFGYIFQATYYKSMESTLLSRKKKLTKLSTATMFTSFGTNTKFEVVKYDKWLLGRYNFPISLQLWNMS